MDGKRVVSFGETGSGGYTNNMTAINAMGYSIDQFKTEDLDLADGCAAITEGLLDCMIYYGAVHTSAVEEMRAGPAGLKILELTEEEVATACKNNPIFKPRILENAYPEIPPLRTFGAGFGLYANESIPDEVTYEITKLIDEHLDEMIAVLDLAKESTLENCVDAVSFVPMAGGTQKYLREKGLVK
jgi:TRAP transporter TAXI family solute receptor